MTGWELDRGGKTPPKGGGEKSGGKAPGGKRRGGGKPPDTSRGIYACSTEH